MGKKSGAIAFVTPKYPPVPSGFGNQAFAVNELLRSRVRMFLLTVGNVGQPMSEAHHAARNIEHQPRKERAWDMLWWFLSSVLWMLRNRNMFDIIHILSGYYWSIPFVLLGRALRKPTIVKITSGEIDLSVRDTLVRRLRIRLVRAASRIVVLTDHARQSALRHGFKESQVRRIPNGVNLEMLRPVDSESRKKLRNELGIPPDAFVVLFVGEVGLRKGIDRVLRAWRLFYSGRSERAVLIMVGHFDGSIPVTEVTGTAGVVITGHVSNPIEYYRVADCFILLSRSEGLANVLLEAAASGLELVVSDIPPNRELAQLLGGRVASGDDLEMTKQAAEHLADICDAMKFPRWRRESRRAAIQHFSLESVADKYHALYTELVLQRTS